METRTPTATPAGSSTPRTAAAAAPPPCAANPSATTTTKNAPDSRTAIQNALGSIFLRIAQNEIDLRRAGLLLYTLQIASTNLAAAQKEQSQSADQPTDSTADPTHNAASSRHGWGPQPQRSDRTAIQDALGKLFPRIDDQQLEPRRAGLLLYCLQIASANLKASKLAPQKSQETREAEGTREAERTSETEGAPGFSPVKSQPLTRGFSPGPSTAEVHTQASRGRPCTNHAKRIQPAATASESLGPAPSALGPSKGRPIPRSTFAALLEALARRQGIDVEKLHDANNATILLRLNAAAEDSPKCERPIHAA